MMDHTHCRTNPEWILVPVVPELSHSGEFEEKAKPIDRCIAPIVSALNHADIMTTGSCCGHGEGPGEILLADGRSLTIHEKADDIKAVMRRVHAEAPHPMDAYRQERRAAAPAAPVDDPAPTMIGDVAAEWRDELAMIGRAPVPVPEPTTGVHADCARLAEFMVTRIERLTAHLATTLRRASWAEAERDRLAAEVEGLRSRITKLASDWDAKGHVGFGAALRSALTEGQG